MFIAVLFVVARNWKHLRCPSYTNLIMDKENVVHLYLMEYYSAVQNKGIIKFSGKWMKLENILGELIKS